MHDKTTVLKGSQKITGFGIGQKEDKSNLSGYVSERSAVKPENRKLLPIRSSDVNVVFCMLFPFLIIVPVNSCRQQDYITKC